VRDFYRNPMLYYLLAPILVATWPLLVWGVYLPGAKKAVQEDAAGCEKGVDYIQEILKYRPEGDPGKVAAPTAFSFPNAIDRVSNLVGIRSNGRRYTAGNTITINGKKSQNGKVVLKDVGIVQAATFISQMQAMYINLKCDQIKLSAKKGVPDQWDADLNFWYTY
jgi:hypothetical protein